NGALKTYHQTRAK
ncbi:hypothetical protein D030_4202B, partial [Vibrio parahaemolyticus AQ3810]